MITFFEELSMNAWPALQTHLYDGWVLRFSKGYTKRANSVNPIYPSQLPVDEKIRYCESLYTGFNLPVVFKITTERLQLDEQLKQNGYHRVGETTVMIADIEQWRPEGKGNDVIIHEGLTDDWLAAQLKLSGVTDPEQAETAGMMLKSIKGRTLFASKMLNGSIIGCGLGVIEQNHMGIFDIVVDENQRRKGFGREIVSALLKKASELNAGKAYLQVVVGNHPAERLYQSLGFKEAYRYWYMIK